MTGQIGLSRLKMEDRPICMHLCGVVRPLFQILHFPASLFNPSDSIVFRPFHRVFPFSSSICDSLRHFPGSRPNMFSRFIEVTDCAAISLACDSRPVHCRLA